MLHQPSNKNGSDGSLFGYHIHIYFNAAAQKKAEAVANDLQRRFPDAVEDVHRVGKVGPHTTQNIGVVIKPEGFGEVVGWLQRHSEGLSILVHPVSNDDLKDHADAAMWIGKPVDLNLGFFRPRPPKP